MANGSRLRAVCTLRALSADRGKRHRRNAAQVALCKGGSRGDDVVDVMLTRSTIRSVRSIAERLPAPRVSRGVS